ncbi:MAG: hypothetical protein HFH68_07610 [Lachnospiraceae bacterium]|nr:hypothetical protein [Lachnospiraceae bacterium]
MRKKIRNIIIVSILFYIAVISGYFYKKSNTLKELPVYENTAVYPKFTLPQLTDKASYIVNARVINVGKTINNEIPVSLTGDPDDISETLYTPVTPITLKIKNKLKGEINTDTVTYYEDGGITPSYVQLPSGYAMEEGMDVILFLNDEGYCWGAQSIFPVTGNSVILSNSALEYVNNKDVSVINKDSIKSDIRSQIDIDRVKVMDIEKFMSVIDSIIG